jgi:uncharacterized delta-60 repeat protein
MELIRKATLAVCTLLALGALASAAQAGGRNHHLRLGNTSYLLDLATDGGGGLVGVWATAQCEHVGFEECDSTRLMLSRLRPNGKLDRTFSRDGSVTIPNGETVAVSPGSAAYVVGLGVQPDGRILVVTRRFMARFGPKGRLDQSFGDGGFVITDQRVSPYPFYGHGLVLAQDGSFALVGSAYDSAPRWAVARYRADGTLVPSFGVDGVARFSVPHQTGSSFGVTSAAFQPDGRMVLGGAAGTAAPFELGFAAARLLPDGSLDPSFGGGDGVATTAHFGPSPSPTAVVTRVSVVADGRITLAGSQNRSQWDHGGCDLSRIARLEADGSIDASFGAGGVTTDSPPCAAPVDAALGPDGDVITVANGTDYFEQNMPLYTARYGSDGRFDPGFADGSYASGRFVANYTSRASQIVPLGRGYAIGGNVLSSACASRTDPDGVLCQAIAITRYHADGTPDRGFAGDGLFVRPAILR